MNASFDSIERHLAALGRVKLLSLLAPGAAPQRVRTVLEGMGLPSRADLERLYGWHDGTLASSSATLGDIYMFPGFYFQRLEDAEADYRAFASDARWVPGWLPVFANGGGDFYVVDLGPTGNGAVRHFRIEETEHPVEYESLTRMIETLDAAFETGAFFVGSNGYLDMDANHFARLAAGINPTVHWWRNP